MSISRYWRGVVFPVFLAIFSLALTIFFTTQPARGYSSSLTVVPSWGTSVVADHTTDFPGCQVTTTEYLCENLPNNTLYTLSETPFCDDYETAKIAMKFDLTALPADATVTNVQLQVVVSTPTFETQTVRRAATNSPETLNCSTSSLNNTLSGTGTVNYATFTNWNSSGAKTLNLGQNAINDVQARVGTNDALTLSITANGDQYGAIYSQHASASNRPKLIIAYTQPPIIPTGFAHNAVSTDSISWAWSEQALSDTDNVVHDQNHHATCTAGPAAGTGNSVSCTETGLQPNTPYTRHPSVIDAEGTTDGAGAAAFTAIESPTGVDIDSTAAAQIAVSSNSPLSNLQSAQSGVYFEEATTGRSSGWTKSTDWTISDLFPNTLYTFRLQARNGDGVTTPMSSSASAYTMAANPNVVSSRQTNAWYTTSDFSFTNAGGWGSGGVEYFRYAWDVDPIHQFSGNEPTWSNDHSACPNGSCAVNTAEFQATAAVDGNWYLHVQPYNRAGQPGPEATYGPYFLDGTAPSTPSLPLDVTSSGRQRFTRDLTSLSISWTSAKDGTSGLSEYQVAVGTAPGSGDVRDFRSVGLSTKAVINGLALQNGRTYYISVRTVDQAGNASASVYDRVFANNQLPRIIDRQANDKVHRAAGGTKYNVDFTKAITGPLLESAQYAVYSKPNMRGQRLLGWTNIFTSQRSGFTNNWRVNFAALKLGTNYISVRTVAEDGFVTQKVDAFTIIKDTSPAPRVSGLLFSTFSRTTGPIELLILGQGFKPGVQVWVGKQKASAVRITGRGRLEATVSGARLNDGGHDLRVVNPNGRQAVRRNKIIILP